MMMRVDRLLRERDIDPQAVLGSMQLEGLGSDERVPFATVDTVIEQAFGLLGEDLGLALACVRDDEAYGVTGLLLATSPNLRQGLKRVFALQRLWGDGERFTLREDSRSVTVAYRHPGSSKLARAVLAECALAEVLESARRLVRRDAVALQVRLAHAPLGSTEELQRYFGVAPAHEQAANEITLDAGLMDSPIVIERELLRSELERRCQNALAVLPELASIGDRVRRALASWTDPQSVAQVAARFRMSTRTLQRKLRAEGASFQELVDAARRTRAARLLERGGSRKEVALELGYSDPSGFVRARRRWKT